MKNKKQDIVTEREARSIFDNPPTTRSLIYLASPYTHPDPEVREQRFEAVTRHAAELVVMGQPVFSPITHTHLMVKVYGLKIDWETWWPMNKAFMDSSKAVIILKLDGWDESMGVAKEEMYANENNIPIKYRDDHGDGKVVFPEMLCPRAMDEVREVLNHGEEKHAGEWKGKKSGYHYAHLMGHLNDWKCTNNEKESGLSHLAHAVSRALFLLEKDLC